jgi:hypothetical protein
MYCLYTIVTRQYSLKFGGWLVTVIYVLSVYSYNETVQFEIWWVACDSYICIFCIQL